MVYKKIIIFAQRIFFIKMLMVFFLTGVFSLTVKAYDNEDYCEYGYDYAYEYLYEYLYNEEYIFERLFFPVPVIDLVLLIDVSGSMNTTDPRGIVLSSAGELINLLPMGSRVAVVAFSGEIEYYLPLRYLGTEVSVTELRREIMNFEYSGFTDIGAGMLLAAEILINAGELNNPKIIFFSDGYIHISVHAENRTNNRSRRDVFTALEMLDGAVPIYTIGLDNPGNFDAELLAAISRDTGGFTQTIYDVLDLPGRLNTLLQFHAAMSYVPEEEYIEEIIIVETVYEEEPDIYEYYEYEEYEEYEYEYETEYEYVPVVEFIYTPTPTNPLLFVMAIFFSITAAISVFILIRAVLL